MMGRIQRLTLNADETEFIDLTTPGSDKCKVMIYVAGANNVRLAYNEGELTYAYFTLVAGQTYVFDGPNPFTQAMYVQCPGAASLLELWITNSGGPY